ncbi:agmatine deiminase family protein [Candidatus Bipolaricaulota bacterium]|nr:agmatine deiminase family protein [Candidatus Bipolaricaulota bacterium]
MRNPAEFELTEKVLINYGAEDEFGITLETIAEIAEDVEIVTIVDSEVQQKVVKSIYRNSNIDNFIFIISPSNSYWTRDYGPYFRFKQTKKSQYEIEVVDFNYDRPRPSDDEIPGIYANREGLSMVSVPLELSGGNYMTDGCGTAASTELIWSGSPGIDRVETESLLSTYLGINSYHVIPDALDLYIKHIDCWAKFLSPDTVMVLKLPPVHDRYEELERAAQYFNNQISCYGTPYDVVRIYGGANAAPYTSSLILNDKILVPQTGGQWDNEALNTYKRVMPGYEVIGFSAPSEHPWLSTDGLHCRVKGIPDDEMIYIEHTPLTDSLPAKNGFQVKARAISYGNAPFTNNTPVLYWKTGGKWKRLYMKEDKRHLFYADIPNQPGGTVINYYIKAEDSNGKIRKHPYIGALDPHSFYVKKEISLQIRKEGVVSG